MAPSTPVLMVAALALGGAFSACSTSPNGGGSPAASGGVSGAAAGGATGGGVDAGAAGDGKAGGAGGAATGGGSGARDAGTATGDAADARVDAAADASGIDVSRADAGAPDVRPADARDAGPATADARADTGTAPNTCNTAGAAGPQTPTVWIIGDSTASLYTGDLFPRMGWGQPFGDFFTPACVTVQDKALSGRSSKSFFDEGAWTPISAALRAGDFVLIQFGHNDEKSDDPALFTDPFTTYEQYLSIYIDGARAKGATPILLTSINRNDWTNGLLNDTHGDEPVAARQLAAAKQVTLVDMTALTKTYFERIGQTATTLLFMDLAVGQFPNYPAGNVDNTHLQEGGARLIGEMTLADLYRQRLPPGTLTKAPPQAP